MVGHPDLSILPRGPASEACPRPPHYRVAKTGASLRSASSKLAHALPTTGWPKRGLQISQFEACLRPPHYRMTKTGASLRSASSKLAHALPTTAWPKRELRSDQPVRSLPSPSPLQDGQNGSARSVRSLPPPFPLQPGWQKRERQS